MSPRHRWIGLRPTQRKYKHIITHYCRITPYIYAPIILNRTVKLKLNSSDFDEHFHLCDEDVVAFPNLGRDAYLIVPCPPSNDKQSGSGTSENSSVYGHLAAFMTLNNNLQQIHHFWIKVAEILENRISQVKDKQPIWLSTCGTGVYWLHVRLDSRPKYYSYKNYRNIQ